MLALHQYGIHDPLMAGKRSPLHGRKKIAGLTVDNPVNKRAVDQPAQNQPIRYQGLTGVLQNALIKPRTPRTDSARPDRRQRRHQHRCSDRCATSAAQQPVAETRHAFRPATTPPSPSGADLLNWAAVHWKLYYEQTLRLSLVDLRRISCVIFAELC